MEQKGSKTRRNKTERETTNKTHLVEETKAYPLHTPNTSTHLSRLKQGSDNGPPQVRPSCKTERSKSAHPFEIGDPIREITSRPGPPPSSPAGAAGNSSSNLSSSPSACCCCLRGRRLPAPRSHPPSRFWRWLSLAKENKLAFLSRQ